MSEPHFHLHAFEQLLSIVSETISLHWDTMSPVEQVQIIQHLLDIIIQTAGKYDNCNMI